jgi:hypothetical protein
VVVPAVKAVAEAMEPYLKKALKQGRASGKAKSAEIMADALKGVSIAPRPVDITGLVEAATASS